ncbi:hypothetical protein K431DRAFT_24806 [Polychaeton citri CBS 116435]|uniref:Uncharacterized protein n=1 Tax=Polychaeton citri CBS 116435 TaxID=1314669 RepID=A0A9P4PYQ7_9PEZI|nr:hypothetical protein K431DRAFT_24806 [Polychaeton citri CBS 116435]
MAVRVWLPENSGMAPKTPASSMDHFMHLGISNSLPDDFSRTGDLLLPRYPCEVESAGGFLLVGGYRQAASGASKADSLRVLPARSTCSKPRTPPCCCCCCSCSCSCCCYCAATSSP